MVVVIFGWIVLGTLVGLAVMQSIYVWLHCRFLHSKVVAEFNDSYVPKVAIVLCVRGADPSLVKCLSGLVQQDYPNYEIHVVGDDKQDPGLETVRDFFANQEIAPPTIHVLTEHSETRSLKCSAIIGAVSEMDDAIEVVALVDADAVADPNWLTKLIQPLADNSIGATTGNRWFEPESKSFAAAFRQAWNAAAICQMTLYSIPWGGSLAIKRSTIQRCRLIDHWSRSFCEDTMLTRILQTNHLRMVRVPDVVLANEESATMAATFRWVVRQLLTVRLYHRDWPLVFAHGIFLGFCWIAVPVVLMLLFINGETKLGGLLLLTFLLFEIGYNGLFAAIRRANLKSVHRPGLSGPRGQSAGDRMLAILVTQLIYPVAVLKAATAKRVSWRGIDYAIGPGNKVTMLAYRPFLGSIKQASETGKYERSIS